MSARMHAVHHGGQVQRRLFVRHDEVKLQCTVCCRAWTNCCLTAGKMQHGLCTHAVTATSLAQQEAQCEFCHACKPLDNNHTDNMARYSCGTNQVLKHKEELIVFPDHFLQLDHTGVVQLTEGLDLSQRHAFFPAEELAFHFFDGHLYCQRGSNFALHSFQQHNTCKANLWVVHLHVNLHSLTGSLVCMLTAFHTLPYVPSPSCLVTLYLGSANQSQRCEVAQFALCT